VDPLEVVILAAGLGTRLDRPVPKTLTTLRSGETILERQLSGLRSVCGEQVRVAVVVGFKLELVMEAAPDAVFVYNERYDRTNTSKSLLKALRSTRPDAGVLWMNGDVVFDLEVLKRAVALAEDGRSGVLVNRSAVGEEEVTFTMSDDGAVDRLAKKVPGGLGEAVGINYVAAADKPALVRRLAQCEDQDYFERGIELTISEDGIRWSPQDIADLAAMEVDFEEDLEAVNRTFGRLG